MNELTDLDEDSLGWVYPAQPQTEITLIEEIAGIISGTAGLVEDQDYIDVVFGSDQPSEDWVLLETIIFNTSDLTPLNIWPGIITEKTVSGFRLQLNGLPDSGNYYLSWSIRGVFGYYLSGPTSGTAGIASTAFTVRLPDESTMTGTAVITPDDDDETGTFTPSTVELTLEEPSATFTYTPSSYGARSISVTNNRGLVNPPQIGFIVTASTYTLSGPSSGIVDEYSTDFTVALPVDGVVAGTLTVTPSDGGSGTFTPTTATLTTAAPSDTFTYRPASAGAKTISVTNNGGLTNPVNLTYTASNPSFLDLFTGTGTLDAHTSDTSHTWADVSGVSHVNISSGSAYGSSAGGAEVFTNFTPSSADHEASITIVKGSVSGAPEIGVWLRATVFGASNWQGYMGRLSQASGLQFYRLDPPISFTQIGVNTAGSLADGDVLRFTVSGTGATVTLSLYKNGVLQYSATDTSGSRIVGNGKIGIHMYDPSNGAGNYRITKMVSP